MVMVTELAVVPTDENPIPAKAVGSIDRDDRLWEQYVEMVRTLRERWDPEIAYRAMLLAVDLGIYVPSAP